MDWFSLIPAALGALGGIFSGGQSTSTTTPTMSPELKKAASDALTKATAIWNKPYQAYTGERVAGPTQARAQLDPIMANIGAQTQTGVNNSNAMSSFLAKMANRGPGSISTPTLTAPSPKSTYTRGAMPTLLLPPPVAAQPVTTIPKTMPASVQTTMPKAPSTSPMTITGVDPDLYTSGASGSSPPATTPVTSPPVTPPVTPPVVTPTPWHRHRGDGGASGGSPRLN